MDNWRIIRGICIVPFVISLFVCVVSMFTGVTNGLFGVYSVDYGYDAFVWMLLLELTLFWWLYIACIIGIIVATVAIIRSKKEKQDV